MAADHAPRGADAVHLASALPLGDTGTLLADWDQRLLAGVTPPGSG